MVLLIDNYDSFTYNLYQYISHLDFKVQVFKNDEINISDIKKLEPQAIVLSPGPGNPKNSGISLPIIQTFSGQIPILGICLGHQAIGFVFGAKITQSNKIMHGKPSLVYHQNHQLFYQIPNPFEAVRYHSLLINSKLTSDLKCLAHTSDGEIMAISHNYKPFLYGLQFHPESILTNHGLKILRNFFKICLASESIS